MGKKVNPADGSWVAVVRGRERRDVKMKSQR